jgi:hypothetical protein
MPLTRQVGQPLRYFFRPVVVGGGVIEMMNSSE